MIVRKLRLQRGWTQEHLAELAGLSVRSIQRIERGGAVGLETINSLAAVFEVDRSLFTPGETAVETRPSPQPDSPPPPPTGSAPLRSDEAEAMEYVKGLKEFYGHVFLYVVFVTVFGFALGFERPMILIGAIGWGIGVIINGLNAYEVIHLFGPGWERRQVEKRLGRRLQ
jgi:transcriptional regulator with XRE-family HTH domain